MSTGVNGTWFGDNDSDLNAAKFNKLNPHGFIYQDDGDGALEVSVMPANWIESDGTANEYSGSNGNAIPTSVTRWIYIDDANALQVAAALPALSNDFWICGKVITNGSQVTEIHNYNCSSMSCRT